jgi:GT2 family glycosyltransferase
LHKIINEGFRSFFWKIHENRRQKTILIVTKSVEPLSKLIITSITDQIEPIQKKVSIVIPTKDAGDDFIYTLQKIQNQIGIDIIELIIIDSGSTDLTLEYAKKYNPLIITIKPEDFNHGKTRNIAAETATGEYLLFLVQDAIPIGRMWLYQVIKMLQSDPQIAAVTCRQVPRTDSDLFSNYTMWAHYNAFDMNENKITHISSQMSKNLSSKNKRALSGLDNVCCCYKMDIFKKFQFKEISFAEDLEIGLRLSTAGYKLGFLNSAGVIHSHKRSEEYCLKRSFIDSKVLFDILREKKYIEQKNRIRVIRSLLSLYFMLNSNLAKSLFQGDKQNDAIKLFDQFKKNIFIEYSETSTVIFEQNFDMLVHEIKKSCNIDWEDDDYVFEGFLQCIGDFFHYLRILNNTYDNETIIPAILKIYASFCGNYLANLYLSDPSSDIYKKIDALLSGGV